MNETTTATTTDSVPATPEAAEPQVTQTDATVVLGGGQYEERDLPLDLITVDRDLQARVRLDQDFIENQLVPAVKKGEARKGDPAVVFHYVTDEESGKKDKKTGEPILVKVDHYDLADGFHWRQAHELAGKKKMRVQVREGDRTDALRYALSANAFHGRNRTTEDKKRAITLTLQNKKALKADSNKAIARICRVSEQLVADVREDWEKLHGADATRTGADGRVRTAHRKPAGGAAKEYEREVKKAQENIATARKPEGIRIPEAGRTKPKGMLDIVGREVPETLAHVFKANVQIDGTLAALNNALVAVELLRRSGALAWANKSVESNIKAVIADLKAAKPALVCDQCGGEGCKACKLGDTPMGFFPVSYWDGLTKAEREALEKAVTEEEETSDAGEVPAAK